jgi:hypothetical protein
MFQVPGFSFPRSEFGAGSEASSGQVRFQISGFKWRKVPLLLYWRPKNKTNGQNPDRLMMLEKEELESIKLQKH